MPHGTFSPSQPTPAKKISAVYAFQKRLFAPTRLEIEIKRPLIPPGLCIALRDRLYLISRSRLIEIRMEAKM